MPNFYVTTPIYYVNDRPHIGHCYTTLIADVLARFQRLQVGRLVGRLVDRLSEPTLPSANTEESARKADLPAGVFFLTGTDEHAEKVVTTAAERGLTTMQWADQNSAAFQEVFRELNFSFDDFIRTTQDRHKVKVGQYLARLLKTGDVAQGEYEGWYDVNDEAYVTETKAKEQNYLAGNGKPLVRRKEKNYYFKLSQYQSWIEAAITSGELRVEPEARRNEVLGRLREGLQDVPITRPVTDDPATQFGVRVPGDPGHRAYVWIDALFNYLSAVDTPERRHLWPPSVQLMGKEILWFHAVIWPAVLKALGEPLPKLLYAHSHYTRDGKKMSKSLGNFIDLETIRAYTNRYGVDALRWYLTTQGPLHATDADFSHSKFIEVYNSDLANGIGNCASRVSNMIEKYSAGKVPEAQLTAARTWWETQHATTAADVSSRLDRAEITEALGRVRGIISSVDQYIAESRPFSLAKDMATNSVAVANILYTCAEALRIASLLLAPVMPTKMAELWKAWNCEPPAGVPLDQLCAFAGSHGLKPGQTISKGEALFMRADPAEAPPTPKQA